MTKLENENEYEALQNFATKLGLLVSRYYEFDGRKKGWRYYLTSLGVSVSPPLNYEGLNLFMLGWNNCLKQANK